MRPKDCKKLRIRNVCFLSDVGEKLANFEARVPYTLDLN